jgi:hypothetical protein
VRALELFSGGGGAALGIRAAGCVGYGVEWDAEAVATSRAAGLTVEQADIRQWSGNDWRAKHGSPWLLWASPPCQAFSALGQRKGAADERNGWPWTLRIVDEGTDPAQRGELWRRVGLSRLLLDPRGGASFRGALPICQRVEAKRG